MKRLVLLSIMLVMGQLAYSKDRICCGEEFPIGGVLTSANGKYSLYFQDDKNLVLYKNKKDKSGTEKPLWASSTVGRASKCVMQADGNFVLYNGNSAVWSSGTYGKTNAVLIVQNDGNLVIYSGDKAIWSTNTAQPAEDRLTGAEFPIGSVLTSPNGKYSLYFQDDRNLVLYKNKADQSGTEKPLWASSTVGKVNKCFMQDDGNFVLYNDTTPVWASNTNGNVKATLVIQDDGNMVIYAAGNRAVWSTNTVQH